MGLIDKIFSGGAGEVLGATGVLAKDIREAIKGKEGDPDKELELLHKGYKIQAEITSENQKHRSLFVAGWRPFIGWICGISIGLYFIPQYVMASYLWVTMCIDKNELLQYPISSEQIIELALLMMGMAGLRTFDKSKGKTR